ncbi:hypothetical protein WR25_22384 [Diploscapter pachys]|uniref:MOSC domain-containing protein n=1 Tax=Diploscapter pachys TaxID=2018661 RepID=A0A2A2L4P3_9BILA|nr:hypothetical protein WR25_22384 [Diploscapter pachys]
MEKLESKIFAFLEFQSFCRFYTARQKPRLILLESCIVENVLSIKAPDGRTIDIGLDEVKKRKDIRPAFLFEQLRQDGYDCGEDVAKFLSEYIEESNTRLLMWDKNLYTERNCVTNDNWWNNPVTSTNFRPVILVDKCRAYDEDKWAEVRIGDVELQCFKPCDRCVLTTVDPETGVKDPNNQPLKKLREYRLAPEGKMRKEYKDSPMFGVCAGTNKPVRFVEN